MPNQQERVAGGLLGLLVGDALGVPYEFKSSLEIPAVGLIEYEPPSGYDRTYPWIKPGTWSDDGAQALCMLASLLECNRFDPEDFARRLLDWYFKGYLAVDNNVFDCGITTAAAIRQLQAGTPPLQGGATHESANGNGSLMRVLPLALWHQGSDEELVTDAMNQSKITHGHLRSQVCCALYCLWGRRVLHQSDNAWQGAITSLEQICAKDEDVLHELHENVCPNEPTKNPGSGYVVDTLLSARDVMEEGAYERIVRKAIALGQDTDTTACVAGGIAGLLRGIEDIPVRWREGLRGKELYEPLLERLLERANG